MGLSDRSDRCTVAAILRASASRILKMLEPENLWGMQSKVIRGHQCPSVPISGPPLTLSTQSQVIRGHQCPSVPISAHQWPSTHLEHQFSLSMASHSSSMLSERYSPVSLGLPAGSSPQSATPDRSSVCSRLPGIMMSCAIAPSAPER